jgi:hypothetical protein
MKGTPMQQLEVGLEENMLVYDEDGEFAMKFCVQEVTRRDVKLYFEIRLLNPDGSYMFTAKPYIWDTELLTPFELEVSDGGEPENFLSVTVTEFRRGRASLEVVPPRGWKVIPEREAAQEE